MFRIYLLITIFFLLSIQSALSEIHSIERNKQGRIILSADTCGEIELELKNLQIWEKKNNSIKCSEPKEIKLPEKLRASCEVDITDCVPEHVKRYHMVWAKRDGPNCWNLSLVMSEILPSLRYTTPEEMDFFMGPPLCRKLDENEPRLPGDVIAIRKKIGFLHEEVHGLIYISDNLCYSKNGSSRDSPYALQKVKEVFDIYGVNSRPLKCLLDDSCFVKTDYYRCISTQEYLRRKSYSQEELKKLLMLECYTGYYAMNGVLPQDGLRDFLIETMNVLKHYVTEESKEEKLSLLTEEEVFILTSIKLRLESIDITSKR